MTEDRKVFRSRSRGKPPIEFDIEVDNHRTGTTDTVTFHCAPSIPAAMLEGMVGIVGATEAQQGEAMLGFLDSVLVSDEEREQWRQLKSDPGRFIQAEDVGDVVIWLIEKYSGDRPTVPPASSSSTPIPAGGGLMDGSFSQDKTGEVSTSVTI